MTTTTMTQEEQIKELKRKLRETRRELHEAEHDLISPYRINEISREQSASRYLYGNPMYPSNQIDLLEHVGSGYESLEAAPEAYRRLDAFLKRRLRYLEHGGLEKLFDHFEIPDDVPFFRDHERLFWDQSTGGRVYTSQPYFPAYASTSERTEEEKAEHDRFMNNVSSWADVTIPEHVEAVLARLRRTVGDFAKQHSLGFDVTFNGSWYNPGRSVMIILTR